MPRSPERGDDQLTDNSRYRHVVVAGISDSYKDSGVLAITTITELIYA